MIDRDIKIFWLKAILRRRAPVGRENLKSLARAAFVGVSMADGDLNQYIGEMEEAGLIAGTDDAVLGLMYDLTTTGKIKAQQL